MFTEGFFFKEAFAMKQIYKWFAVSGLAASAMLFPSGARAAAVFQNGATYDGWVVTAAPGISLVVDSDTGSTLSLEKFATFTTPNEGLFITFTQASSNAASSIDFNEESVTNATGSPWSTFQFLLADDTGSPSFVQNSDSPFAPPAGYTSSTFGTDTLTYIGSQANFATSFWGNGPDGELLINADPLGIGTTFSFKEIPSTGSTPPPAPVPLPAALWQGTAGLLGLGLVAAFKKRKQTIA
jgi:hypothetical protein